MVTSVPNVLARRLAATGRLRDRARASVARSLPGHVLVYSPLGMSIAAGAVPKPGTAPAGPFHPTNCRTPHRVRNVFQRPEMHRNHHAPDAHRRDDRLVGRSNVVRTSRDAPARDGARGATFRRGMCAS
jgi:hypothetical protein